MSLASKAIAKTATLLYRGVEFVSMNIVATHKLTMTLDYRRRWSTFLPAARPEKASLWIHGASVGELEDLASFYGSANLLSKAGYEPSQLVLTSSSPSAEEFLLKMKTKLSPLYAGPLPPDVLPRVEEFFEKLNPEILILSQSDTWPVLMDYANGRLKKGAIWLPHKSSSASWSKKWLLEPIVKLVGLRRQDSENPLPKVKSSFVGSPRVDRILERIESSTAEHPLKAQLQSSQLKIKILIGSAWKEDGRIVKEALSKLRSEDQKIFEVYAIPHDTKNSAETSAIAAYLGKNVILKDGILLESYDSFDLAFVGGGFRTGLHNIVEPLAWGIPTLCGDDLRKQPEAEHYVRQGALKSVSSSEELRKILLSVMNNDQTFDEWKAKATEAKSQLKSQRGASARLAELIKTI